MPKQARSIPNTYHHIDADTTAITVMRRNGDQHDVIVDRWVFDLVLHKLQLHVNEVRSGRREVYAKTYLDGKPVLLHRLLAETDCTDDLPELDHIDGTSLNNKFDNLRAADRRMQMQNSRTCNACPRRAQP